MPDTAVLRMPVYEYLVMAFMLLGIGQALRVFLMATRKEDRPISLVTIYESCVFVLILLLMAAIYSSCILAPEMQGDAPSWSLLWFAVVPACLGIFLCIRLRRPAMAVAPVAFAAVVPGIAGMLPCPFSAICLAVCAVLVTRTAYGLVIDISRTRHSVSRLSVKEAVDRLPEGLLFASQDGRPLIINDRMDAFLCSLDMPVNRLDTDKLWSELASGIEAGRIEGEALGRGLLVRTPDANTFLIASEEVDIPSHRGIGKRRRSYSCMRAIDMTREDMLVREIERANTGLEQSEGEIRKALLGVEAVARNEGILRMRSRVHDVIGQRLSILHRFLEGGNLSDEAVAGIIPMLADLTHDISDEAAEDSPIGMADLVSSFSLIGVEIAISGEMPQDRRVGAAFSRVLREAATNAVRHGHAQHIDVQLLCAPGASAGSTRYEMDVSDDGTPPEGDIVEKTGLAGMRRVLAEAEGTLQVQARPAFRLIAAIEGKATPGEGDAR